MLHWFLRSLGRFARLAVWSLWPPAGCGARRSWRRVLVMVPFLMLLALVQAVHWLGFLLDELFFRGYRRVQVRAPLFVLGVPRSGTTYLHGVLADDPQFTTFSTWECLFALSVSARRFWLLVGTLDRRVGRPLGRLAALVERHALGGLDDVHPVRLDSPEEDYFCLVPIFACFILMVPFPYAGWIRRMAYFDRDLDAAEQRRVLDYYETCLKKHLYVHGEHLTLLSKNAAFASLAAGLAERFPEARFICCLRDPVRTVPSQLSSLRSGIDLFDNDPASPRFTDEFVEMLGWDYVHLHDVLASLPSHRAQFVDMSRLREDLAGFVPEAYARLGLDLQPQFRESLARHAAAGQEFRSAHRYATADFGLTDEDLGTRLADAYASYRQALDRNGAAS
ncbi:MAG: sulfotransferase [Pseudomonadales bacterium]